MAETSTEAGYQSSDIFKYGALVDVVITVALADLTLIFL